MFQEAKLLRDAIFPSLLCSAARQGNIDMLKELREVVSNLVEDQHLKGAVFLKKVGCHHSPSPASITSKFKLEANIIITMKCTGRVQLTTSLIFWHSSYENVRREG